MILILTTKSDLSGAPIHVLGLGKLFKDEQLEVLFGFGQNGEISKQLIELNYKVVLFPRLASNYNFFHDIHLIYSLIKIINANNIKILHLHSTKAGFIGKIAKLFTKVRVIYTVHGWGFGSRRHYIRSILIYLIELITSPLVDSYIFVSKFDRSIGRKFIFIDQKKINLIYNTSTRSSSERIYHDNNLVMVARNDPQKDFSTFLKAINRLNDVGQIYLVGRGTDTIEFVESARRIVTTNYDKIHFIGETNSVEEYLSKCSTFILATKYEGLPLSILEAMSNSMCIIASDVGGCGELVEHGVNGFLVQPEEPNQLANMINYVLNNKEMAQEMCRNSRIIFNKKFKNYNIQKLLYIYNSLEF